MKNSTNDDNDATAAETNLSIVPVPHETILYKPNNQFEINVMGNVTDINFYIPDVGDSTGVAFRKAYSAAKYDSKNNKELCSYVGSMLCAVVPGFRNSVVEALNEICVRPRFISLPSQADENRILISRLPELGWPSIVVVFGYCILLLFKLSFHDDSDSNYNHCMSSFIMNLQAKVRWDPSNELLVPFDVRQAKSVTTMLGSDDLRATIKTFLIDNANHNDYNLRNICEILNRRLR
ncbi:unnamed protein product [Lathyrus sativus]|nr:unnamed protein product [Lathyrus sativus]